MRGPAAGQPAAGRRARRARPRRRGARELLAAYGIDLWQRASRSTTADEAVAAGASSSAGTSCSRRPPSTCAQRPDLAHVWRNIDNEAEMRRRLGEHAGSSSTTPSNGRLRRPEERPARACRWRSRGMEDPLFGPVVSFGVSGAADRAARGPGLPDPADAPRATPTTMVREIRAAPLLFGYRGSEPVDVDAVEQLLLRVAQLKNDLPQVRSLELSLVLAGAARRHRARPRVARVEPVADARSDWFVRRLSTQAGDTLHG